jgi:hypothetical protein
MEKIHIPVNCYRPILKNAFSEELRKLVSVNIDKVKGQINAKYKEIDVVEGEGIAIYKGSRYYSNDRLLEVALGSIFDYFEGNHILSIDLSKLDFEEIAYDTIIYSMSCDHWYTFEKDWGN